MDYLGHDHQVIFENFKTRLDHQCLCLVFAPFGSNLKNYILAIGVAELDPFLLYIRKN